MKKTYKILLLLLSAVLAFSSLTACGDLFGTLDSLGEISEVFSEFLNDSESAPTDSALNPDSGGSYASSTEISENGTYTSKEDVALYIHSYGKLPNNFITKDEARSLGWEGGGLDGYADGKCIGGDYFGNYEGLLPKKNGRTYTECDIDTLGADSRGSKRIVFSNDGLIYYTDDHYETFELLYGE